MNILVTGGCGFIGSNFIHYWIHKYPNDKIINLDKLTYAGNEDNLKDLENKENYKFILGDICDKKLVSEIVPGIDIIIHFAAESHVDRSITAPAEFISTNVLGTQVLLDAAEHFKIKKFHHISTDEVFGSLDLNSGVKFNENSSYQPRSPYAASKAASDYLVRSYFYTYNLPITITNCSNNFGPYQHPEKLIPLAITNLLEGKKVPIYGDGLNVRDWLYVEDHCRAIEMVITDGKIGETYCVGGQKQDISNLQVINKILKLLSKDDRSIQLVKDRPGHDRKYAVDSSKIEKELGWKALYDFDTWLEKTMLWYKNNSGWWKKLKNDEFRKYYKNQYNDL